MVQGGGVRVVCDGFAEKLKLHVQVNDGFGEGCPRLPRVRPASGCCGSQWRSQIGTKLHRMCRYRVACGYQVINQWGKWAQMKMARGLLGLNQSELAELTSLSRRALVAFWHGQVRARRTT